MADEAGRHLSDGTINEVVINVWREITLAVG